MNATKHRHRARNTSPIAPFLACCAGRKCKPESHGGHSYSEICACGATKQVNANQGAHETGPWIASPTRRAQTELINAEYARLDRAKVSK